MSAPSPDQTPQGRGAGPSEERPRFTKYVRRASKVLKNFPLRAPVLGSPPEQYYTSTSSSLRRTRTTPSPTLSPPSTGLAMHPPSPARSPSNTTPTMRSSSIPTEKQQPSPSSQRPAFLTPKAAQAFDDQEAKVRSLFSKYNLTLEPGEWVTVNNGEGPRVEKKIRMRVHRQCHRCQRTFGINKTCRGCSHTRCKKCPRFPLVGPMTKEMRMSGMPTGDLRMTKSSRASIVLSMPSKSQGAQDLIRKHPQQRARRLCHICNHLFAGRALDCAVCKHSRCPLCPREPPKPQKHPNGYPGDKTPQEERFTLARRQLKSIRTRVRWKCQECNTTFQAHDRACSGCGHHRCDNCVRDPPKRVARPPDEAAIRGLESRLRNALAGVTGGGGVATLGQGGISAEALRLAKEAGMEVRGIRSGGVESR
ncbi:hypothetical protein MMC25_007045 [Agyrium rufum]|nr:hypothetical protein [Agyrium rufum]